MISFVFCLCFLAWGVVQPGAQMVKYGSQPGQPVCERGLLIGGELGIVCHAPILRTADESEKIFVSARGLHRGWASVWAPPIINRRSAGQFFGLLDFANRSLRRRFNACPDTARDNL
jgi:hypothetical protein